MIDNALLSRDGYQASLRRQSYPAIERLSGTLTIDPPSQTVDEISSPEMLDAEQARLDELDEQLIHLLMARIDGGRLHNLNRRGAGLPTAVLSWENAIVRRYSSRLGREGGDIARALLALSRRITATAQPRFDR